jgi:hypothetical protein
MRFIATWFFAAFSTCDLLAQTTNNQSILGIVQDSSGAVVPNATVTVVSQATNLTRSANSNESGTMLFPTCPLACTMSRPQRKVLRSLF